jgi:hypothetical protein
MFCFPNQEGDEFTDTCMFTTVADQDIILKYVLYNHPTDFKINIEYLDSYDTLCVSMKRICLRNTYDFDTWVSTWSQRHGLKTNVDRLLANNIATIISYAFKSNPTLHASAPKIIKRLKRRSNILYNELNAVVRDLSL